MRPLAVIYLLTNKINGKRYIGFTIHFKRRMREHRRCETNTKNRSPIASAIRKYGWDAFQVSILAESWDTEYAQSVLESQFIREYDSLVSNGLGYNMTGGGQGTHGLKFTEARRKKMSIGIKKAKALKPNRFTPEARARMSLSRKGVRPSPEAIANMAAANRKRTGLPGKPLSEAHKEMMRARMLGTRQSPERIHMTLMNRLEQVCYIRSPDGRVFKTISIKSFAKTNNVAYYILTRSLRTGKMSDRGEWKGWHVFLTQPIDEALRLAHRADMSLPLWQEISNDQVPTVTSEIETAC